VVLKKREARSLQNVGDPHDATIVGRHPNFEDRLRCQEAGDSTCAAYAFPMMLSASLKEPLFMSAEVVDAGIVQYYLPVN
jgi:hypothetical protein